MNTSTIHESMLQYHENMHEYSENMRRYLQFMYEQHSNLATTTPTVARPAANSTVNNRSILIRMIENILRNRNTRETFEDVVVRPTNQQIQTATETVIYNENENETYINNSCPISLDVFRTGDEVCRIKHCSHVFKKTALMNWFRVNVVCPVCRYDIRNYVEYLTPEAPSAPTDDDLYETEPILPRLRNRNNITDAIRTLARNDMYHEYEYFTMDLPIYVDPSGPIYVDPSGNSA